MAELGARFDCSELLKVLAGYAQKTGNLQRPMMIIAEEMVSLVSENFDTEGKGTWPPLSATTLARRRMQGKGAKILLDTGRLAASITPASGNDFAEAYTNVEYGKYHVSAEHGGGDDHPIVPLRDFLAIDASEVEEYAADVILGVITE